MGGKRQTSLRILNSYLAPFGATTLNRPGSRELAGPRSPGKGRLLTGCGLGTSRCRWVSRPLGLTLRIEQSAKLDLVASDNLGEEGEASLVDGQASSGFVRYYRCPYKEDKEDEWLLLSVALQADFPIFERDLPLVVV